jgi:thiosulfate/3-mercaptopyruvate sulfurtransferase
MSFTSIISAKNTFQRLGDPNWRIFDCRFDLQDKHAGLNKYNAGHIPNAIFADLEKDLSSPVTNKSGRHPLPDIKSITHKFGSWGISADTQVVVYDDVYGSYAARLWWLLRWLGHKNVAVLNGGLTEWQRMQLPVTKDIIETESTSFIAKPDMSMIAEVSLIEQSLATSSVTLVDVRDSDRYQGLREPIDKIAGHIPGAINIPWKTNLDNNGLYLEKAKLLSHYSALADKTDTDALVFMCGSGVTACHSLVALEYLNLPVAKLYPGSWSEWIQNPDHPVASSAL